MAEGDDSNAKPPSAARPGDPARRPPPRPALKPVATKPKSALAGVPAAASPAPPVAPPAEDAPAPVAAEVIAKHEAESVRIEGSITGDISLMLPGDNSFDPADYAKEVERIRGLRKPFGTFTQKLALPVRRGYKRHWFNAVPGRIEQKLAEGWAFVTDRESKPIKRVVGTGRDNNALLAYAMEIPEIIWREEQDAFHKVAQAKMDDIRTNPVRAKPGTTTKADAGKFYSPTEEGMVRIVEDPVPQSQF